MAHDPNRILCLSGAEIQHLVDPARGIEALAQGFMALSRGEVHAPPRPKVEVAGKGFTLSMLAVAPGQHIALKAVSVYEGNHELGLASHQATVSLFDRDTGVPLAVMDGASITGLRTAAGAMLSIRAMARADSRIATIIGGGVQARSHAQLLRFVGSFDEIRIYARRAEAAKAVAAGLPNARIVSDLADAVATSDVVCLTTAARHPVIEDGWVLPGTHVTSVGYAPPDSELPRALIDRASLFVESRTAFLPAPVGCAELAGRNATHSAELGEVLLGSKPGRTSAEQVTLYKSMGNAMEDMVIANLAYTEALRLGIGQSVLI